MGTIESISVSAGRVTVRVDPAFRSGYLRDGFFTDYRLPDARLT